MLRNIRLEQTWFAFNNRSFVLGGIVLGAVVGLTMERKTRYKR